ncbi:hypothetical protein APHAL10511_006660 [Amanita phalloides]|nr:hypothetical protein APHAL10511_006660 [Amanita phalloides]
MWNNVVVHLFSEYEEVQIIPQHIRGWLSRSRDSLISLDMGTLMKTHPRAAHDLLQNHRFKKLVMFIPVDQLHSLSQTPAENLRCIEELTVFQSFDAEIYYHWDNPAAYRLTERPFFPMQHFPELQALTIDVNPDVEDLVRAVSCGQLRRLQMRTYMSLQSCMHVLYQCPLLEVLQLEMVPCPLRSDLRVDKAFNDAPPSTKPLILPHLRELFVEFVRSDCCDMMLGMLSLPALKILNLYHISSETTKLRTLEGLVNGRLGPQLQELHVKDCLEVEFVLDIIESRGKRGPASQETLRLVDLSDADISATDQQRIDKLREEGVVIYTESCWWDPFSR